MVQLNNNCHSSVPEFKMNELVKSEVSQNTIFNLDLMSIVGSKKNHMFSGNLEINRLRQFLFPVYENDPTFH